MKILDKLNKTGLKNLTLDSQNSESCDDKDITSGELCCTLGEPDIVCLDGELHCTLRHLQECNDSTYSDERKSVDSEKSSVLLKNKNKEDSAGDDTYIGMNADMPSWHPTL